MKKLFPRLLAVLLIAGLTADPSFASSHQPTVISPSFQSQALSFRLSNFFRGHLSLKKDPTRFVWLLAAPALFVPNIQDAALPAGASASISLISMVGFFLLGLS